MNLPRTATAEPGRTRSSGQTLALFAVLAPGLLALMGLGLDGARIFLERREAQGAADLAALAGVRSLPDDATTAVADARVIGVAHGYTQDQVVPMTPYGGDQSKIEVTIDSSVNPLFLPVLGIFGLGDFSTVDVSARAVAQAEWTTATSDGYAIFALEGCPSLEKSVDISGSSSFLVGRVHSNSDVYISGSTTSFSGAVTSVCGSGYPAFHDGGGGNTYDPAPTTGEHEPDPIGYAITDFSCDFYAPSTGTWDLASNGVWWVGGSKDSKTLRPGTYCARGSSGTIKLGDSDIAIDDVVVDEVYYGPGGVTFVAPYQVEISGSNFELMPHEKDVLFASYGNTDVAVKVAGSGGTWAGLIYAPNGTAEVSGSSNFNFTGGIIGERVKLNGSDATINGDAGLPAAPEQSIALVE
jgi:hypothetical protein